jgi:hypothetical protein
MVCCTRSGREKKKSRGTILISAVE